MTRVFRRIGSSTSRRAPPDLLSGSDCNVLRELAPTFLRHPELHAADGETLACRLRGARATRRPPLPIRFVDVLYEPHACATHTSEHPARERERVPSGSLSLVACTGANGTWQAGPNCARGRMMTDWVRMYDDCASRTKPVTTPLFVRRHTT